MSPADRVSRRPLKFAHGGTLIQATGRTCSDYVIRIWYYILVPEQNLVPDCDTRFWYQTVAQETWYCTSGTKNYSTGIWYQILVSMKPAMKQVRQTLIFTQSMKP